VSRYEAPGKPRHGDRVPRVKTTVPRLPPNLVSRIRLRNLLERSVQENPVTVLCAPAGYGKTLSLADWIAATTAEDKAWVSLDSGDDRPEQFWAGVLGALCACDTVPADSGLHSLVPPAEPEIAGFLDELVDALETLPTPVCLILDDVHECIGSHTRHGIEILLRRQPSALRLVLSTRFDLPLALARLHLEGRLAQIRASRLRFSDEEAAELMRKAGVEVEAGRLRRLVEQTDGWAAGLRLAARSLQNAPDHDEFLDNFAGGDRAVADYLVGEVLSRMSTATRSLLQAVSICDEVTPQLAAAVSGREDAGVVLDSLERETALIGAIGADRPWYRIHPMLRSYLRADLARQHPARAADLHRAAAQWFAAEEQPDLAVHQAERTGDPDAVADLLRQHGVALVLKGEFGVARHALGVLGASAVAADSRLRCLSALVRMAGGDLVGAGAELTQVDAGAAAAGGWSVPRSLAVATYELTCGRRPDLGQPGAEADTPQEQTDLGTWLRTVLGCAGLRSGGDLENASRELEAAEKLASDRGLDYLAMQCLIALGMAAGLRGDYKEMDARCAASTATARRRGWRTSPWLAGSHVLRGFASVLAFDPVAARWHADGAAAALGRTGQAQLRFMIELVEGMAELDDGCARPGLRRMRRARAELRESPVPSQLAALAALAEARATLAIEPDATVREVAGWLQTRTGGVAELPLLRAWEQYARGNLSAARAELHEAATTRPGLAVVTTVETTLLECALAIRAGERTRARDALGAALALAEPADLIRPFAQADARVRQLLMDQLGGFGDSDAFAARVHRVLSGHGPGRRVLTAGEWSVLDRLDSQRPLDEVAAELAVSVNTVKTHVRAIYHKLGVNNRHAAVVTARARGLA
jgi:LuxR family maltose regulon positive regulatory protein